MTENTQTDGQAMAEAMDPKSMGLVHDILTASSRSIQKTMDTLYENEREMRMALEVLIDDVVEALDHAHMGSAREYEYAVKPLRSGSWYDHHMRKALADRHPEREAR